MTNRLLVGIFTVVLCACQLDAAELAVLAKGNWADFILRGKEVDAIYGDLVMRNDAVTAVIAQPTSTRNANMTVRDVGGGLIDYTQRNRPNDQLSAFYPGGGLFKFHDSKKLQIRVDGEVMDWNGDVLTGSVIELRVASSSGPCDAVVTYRLADKQPFIAVTTEYVNSSNDDVSAPIRDSLRADRTFEFDADKNSKLFWAVDDWFRQAYGILAQKQAPTHSGRRGIVVEYEAEPVSLSPGKSYVLERRVLVAPHLAGLRGLAERLSDRPTGRVQVAVNDPAGAVQNARIEVKDSAGVIFGAARTNRAGKAAFNLPPGKWQLVADAIGRPSTMVTHDVRAKQRADVPIKMEACGYVEAAVVDGQGKGIPCKVAFHGIEGTESPDFGPDSGAYGVQNVQYTANGEFKAELAPGQYEVLISHGPETDLVTQKIKVEQGESTPIQATLERVVDTPGWISADFHSHSSPSGDNTGSQRGRVLNLLAEHVEFGPCTEHNRISTYMPHLRALKAVPLMATCPGMELTGNPLVINHQNAFPLKRRPRTQDGGGPTTDTNPVVQIERLAMWDEGSEKLVQSNHPNLPQIVGDKDQDGKFDGGFAGMLGFMDVIEVHPLNGIFSPPVEDPAGRESRNPVFHWMQMLNLGHRIPGVINTDAHYNYHESGWRRNYLASPTDDPAKIQVADVVKAAEQGRIVMTNGPYLHVSSQSPKESAGPGQDLAAPNGRVTLKVRVQCPNWLDVNRVQLFVNGRPSTEHNYTRRTHPKLFGDSVVKFDHELELELKQDAHLIIAAAGEGLELGRVMGPRYGPMMPIAVANPIFVDVDGKGFQANGDLLDVPLPNAKESEESEADEKP